MKKENQNIRFKQIAQKIHIASEIFAAEKIQNPIKNVARFTSNEHAKFHGHQIVCVDVTQCILCDYENS